LQIVNRAFAAVLASSLSIAILAALHDRPTVHEIMAWIDVETILLLFTMMILVGILTETGVFDYLAVYAYKVKLAVFTLGQGFTSHYLKTFSLYVLVCIACE
jgi:Na+/H+ antiporter NhaD/arsenite permease-like protein